MGARARAFGPGTRIGGRYVVEAILAEGGMGAVYRAHDERLGRPVAVKVLLEALASDATSIARFEREATASARLSHPGIVQVLDFGASEGTRYLVMELVRGATLGAEITRAGRLPPARAADVVEQALGAIATAHAAGIVHRDLKPGNLMLVPLGELPAAQGGRELVKVLDFGIAQLKAGDVYTRLTQTGAILGTPTFMSPEQAQGRPLDARTDVYAMGVVLWCCLTGEKPFRANSVAGILERVLGEVPARADRLAPDVPPALALAAQRAMQKDPAARFESAAAFAAALVETRGPSLAPVSTPRATPPTELPTANERLPRPSAGVATAPAVMPSLPDVAPRAQAPSAPSLPLAQAPSAPSLPLAQAPSAPSLPLATPPPSAAAPVPARAPRWIGLALAAVAVLALVGLVTVGVVGLGLYRYWVTTEGGGTAAPTPAPWANPFTPALTPTTPTIAVPPGASPICAATYRCCMAIGLAEATCVLYPTSPDAVCQMGLESFRDIRRQHGDASMCEIGGE